MYGTLSHFRQGIPRYNPEVYPEVVVVDKFPLDSPINIIHTYTYIEAKKNGANVRCIVWKHARVGR